jgi:hypothetical protein
MALEQENKTYAARLDELLPHVGKFVLIHDDEVVDVYAAYEDALKAGYGRFGLGGFMVRRIEQPETSHYLTRDIEDCPT